MGTVRPLRTNFNNVTGAPPIVIGAPRRSGAFSSMQVAPAVPTDGLEPTTPQFVVCSRVAFRCVSAWDTRSAACVEVRGARTPRSASVFARLWDTRGRSPQERANSGGRMRPGAVDWVYNLSHVNYDGGSGVPRLPDALGVVGNNASDTFLWNITEAAIRPGWLWDVNRTAPPPPAPIGR